jgi:formylglycine-generating enzyme required for sulfatase activity
MYTPTWLIVPAGPFIMGSDPRDAAPPFANESPQQRVALPEYRISRVPITNAQYAEFVAATGHPAPGHWLAGPPPQGMEHCPVTYVSWDDAQAFCAWAAVRLPSEAEWEKAARGPAGTSIGSAMDARWWPWGDALPDATRCHFDGQAHGVAPAAQGVLPTGQFPLGASPYGVLDMAGNVWEWTNSLYRAYPYRAGDGREDARAHGARVVRGGTYQHDRRHIRCAARDGMAAGARDVYIGFRVVATDGPPPIALDWVTIPAGEFVMGSERMPRRGAALPSEMPRHTLHLAEFRIAQTPVTNAEYAEYVRACGCTAPAHWPAGGVPRGLGDHPVTHVDWHDALAFCRWAGVRLPNEAEWEKAARGPSTDTDFPRVYPWGDAPPGTTRLNFRRSAKRAATTPVGSHPRGATPYGALDMAGNVWEWVSSAYAPYPYRADDGRENLDSHAQRVLRGGSFASPHARFVRCAMRSLSYPTRRREHIGFRVAL